MKTVFGRTCLFLQCVLGCWGWRILNHSRCISCTCVQRVWFGIFGRWELQQWVLIAYNGISWASRLQICCIIVAPFWWRVPRQFVWLASVATDSKFRLRVWCVFEAKQICFWLRLSHKISYNEYLQTHMSHISSKMRKTLETVQVVPYFTNLTVPWRIIRHI